MVAPMARLRAAEATRVEAEPAGHRMQAGATVVQVLASTQAWVITSHMYVDAQRQAIAVPPEAKELGSEFPPHCTQDCEE